MNNLQEEWSGFYDINFYCTDGIAKVIANEVEISYSGNIQTGAPYLVFEIPLDMKHDAMLEKFFTADGSELHEPWYVHEFDAGQTVEEKWQDYDSWSGVDDVTPIIVAGIRAGDMLAVDLNNWLETLPKYEPRDWREDVNTEIWVQKRRSMEGVFG